ncbi:hypothetical protein [Dactylosporangium sp. CA-233914]|uniref:hypothetical protein n=1 Tax=Dactylosporangium sp. CA-233914 TaxID=3239934 RepID=UPI003D8C5B65
MTNDTDSPVDIYLGVHGGGTIWDVPSSYNWDFTAAQSTTTLVARRLANHTTECFARFRHQPSGVALVSVTGSC